MAAGGPRWCDIGRLLLGGQRAGATCRSISRGPGALWSCLTGGSIRQRWKACRRRVDAVTKGVSLRWDRRRQSCNAVKEFA